MGRARRLTARYAARRAIRERLHDERRGFRRGRGILTRDEIAVAHRESCEIRPRNVASAEFAQSRLEQERHRVLQADGPFLTVGETRHRAASDKWRAIRRSGRYKSCRTMAHGRDHPALAGKARDQIRQRDAIRIIEHRAMAAGQENRVVSVSIQSLETRGFLHRALQLRIGEIALDGFLVFAALFDAARINRNGAARHRCDRHIGAGVFERVVGRRQFFEPQAGRLAASGERSG